MTRSMLLAAVATLASAGAFAQGSVTIYGRMNASVENIDRNGVSTTELVNSSSRIGFKGTEDLGGGLTAGFQLEHGVSIDTGAATHGNQFWARQSEVFLGSQGFGTLRLGNYTSEAYYATADWVSMHNHDTGTSADMLYAYIGRNTNKVGYRSPSFGGVTIDAAASLGEGAAGQERSHDLALNYNTDTLHIGAGYEDNGDANQFAVSALYTMGPFTFGGYVQRDEDGLAADAGNRINVRLVGMYAVGVSEFHLNVGRADSYDNIANSDATQFTLAYNHNLSKRTKLYAFYTELNNDGPVYGGDFRSIAAGIRHNF